MPKTWHIPRKDTTFVVRPYPGAHSMLYSMPLSLVMKELLKCAQTTKEIRYILEKKQVLVDGHRRHDYKVPVGLLDVISLPETNSYYRIVLNSTGKLAAVPIEKEEANMKLCRVMGKTLTLKGKLQVNLSGGRNLFVAKGEYHVGDTLAITLHQQEIKQHLKLEKGSLVYLTGGSHIGETVTVETIEGNKIIIKTDQAS